ncbi:MAG: hypothetical protein ACPG63_08310, partial [Luminiphilus sp.]
SEGKTRNVQTGQQINVEDPEGANAGSPVNHSTFAEDFDDFLFTAGEQGQVGLLRAGYTPVGIDSLQ